MVFNVSYEMHDYCHGHTGAMVTLGQGTITSFSHKQKLNAKSSIEAELIRVDEAQPQILWTWFFLEEQGYNIMANTLYQDNKSSMVMKAKEHMWDDILIKPVQYAKFSQIQWELMNCPIDYNDQSSLYNVSPHLAKLMESSKPTFPLQGCIGINDRQTKCKPRVS